MNDLISRQAAMEMLMAQNVIIDGSEYHNGFNAGVNRAQEVIRNLPPVQSDVPVINVGDMISRQAVIDLLKQMRKDGDMVPWEGKADANHPETPDSWIPVSERLPEKEDCPMDCLVTRKSKTIGNYTDMAVAESDGTWTHEDWKAITFGDRVLGKKAGLISTRDDDIVAWMPLPEPWKGEG